MIVAPIRERSGGGGGGGSDERMLYSRDKNFSVFQENRNNFHPHANLANYFYFPKLNLGWAEYRLKLQPYISPKNEPSKV